jgi:hypothetical protein
MIDKNQRARLGVTLRTDERITHAESRAASAILFDGTDVKTGRCQMFRDRIARQSKVSLRSVDRAIAKLKMLGYLVVVPTYGPRRIVKGGRWFRPRGASVFIWAKLFLVARVAEPPRQESKREAPAPLPEGLASALARFGNAIADRAGLPQAP